ncbi:MAG: Tfp pilus assembly ATPase PilU [Zhongshania sp.]|jgi:Tfp pilus assembly ATPase PilU
MGMAAIDYALFSLYKQGLISRDHASKHVDSEHNIMVKIPLVGEVSDTKFNMEDGEA